MRQNAAADQRRRVPWGLYFYRAFLIMLAFSIFSLSFYPFGSSVALAAEEINWDQYEYAPFFSDGTWSGEVIQPDSSGFSFTSAGLAHYVSPLKQYRVTVNGVSYLASLNRIYGNFDYQLVVDGLSSVFIYHVSSNPFASGLKGKEGTWRISFVPSSSEPFTFKVETIVSQRMDISGFDWIPASKNGGIYQEYVGVSQSSDFRFDGSMTESPFDLYRVRLGSLEGVYKTYYAKATQVSTNRYRFSWISGVNGKVPSDDGIPLEFEWYSEGHSDYPDGMMRLYTNDSTYSHNGYVSVDVAAKCVWVPLAKKGLSGETISCSITSDGVRNDYFLQSSFTLSPYSFYRFTIDGSNVYYGYHEEDVSSIYDIWFLRWCNQNNRTPSSDQFKIHCLKMFSAGSYGHTKDTIGVYSTTKGASFTGTFKVESLIAIDGVMPDLPDDPEESTPEESSSQDPDPDEPDPPEESSPAESESQDPGPDEPDPPEESSPEETLPEVTMPDIDHPNFEDPDPDNPGGSVSPGGDNSAAGYVKFMNFVTVGMVQWWNFWLAAPFIFRALLLSPFVLVVVGLIKKTFHSEV